MKITKDKFDKRYYLHFAKDKGLVWLINDWQQFWGYWNWFSFNLLKVYFESEPMIGESYTFEFAIFGLGFVIRYTKSLKPELEKHLEINKKWKTEGGKLLEEHIDNCSGCALCEP